MKKVILLSVILIFLITGMGFAFQNEPDGFRGLKWGDTPTEDMTFLYQSLAFLGNGNSYYRKDDKLNIGSAKLDRIFYRFTLYNYQFYKVTATFIYKISYDILKIICEGRFGKPTYMREKKDDYLLRWSGDKAKIYLYYDSRECIGWFIIENMKIHSEKPEDNKQKEIEKAKEDF